MNSEARMLALAGAGDLGHYLVGFDLYQGEEGNMGYNFVSMLGSDRDRHGDPDD